MLKECFMVVLVAGTIAVSPSPKPIEIVQNEVVLEETHIEPEVQQEVLYSVNGTVLNPYLQRYLKTKLDAAGIGWWFTYALAQAYQESCFDIYAINQSNHEDMGLFQYKSRYWGSISARYGRAGSDIFDPYAQIDVYVGQIAERLNTRYGDPWYVISDHFTGSCGYSQEYVNQVTQWIFTIREAK